MPTRCALLALTVVLLLPADAEAQRRRGRASPQRGNAFLFEPHAGFFRDAYDIGDDDGRTTWTIGMRLGHRLGWRSRLIGTLAYARSDDVASHPTIEGYNVYDNTWILTTLGAEYDVVPGNTSVALGLQGGVGWRKTTFEEAVGTPLEPGVSDSGYSALEVLAPSLTVRHWFTPRAALTLSGQDYMFDLFEGPVEHSPAATIGVTLR